MVLLEKIPKSYRHFTKTQNSFLKCYFDSRDTQNDFKEIIQKCFQLIMIIIRLSLKRELSSPETRGSA